MNLLLSIFGVIITIILISVTIIKRFAYFQPSLVCQDIPEKYKEITDGSLFGWLIKGSSEKAIFFCHGNGGNISNRINKINNLNAFGYTVIIFDYSGYGKSKGIPTEKQCYQDASIFMDILLKSFPRKNIIIYGESLGAPIGSKIATKYDIPLIILESPLPSIKTYIQYKFRMLSFLSFLFPEFNTIKNLSNYNGKILLLHSTEDDIIPYESTIKLKNISTAFIDMKGTHNNPIIPWDKIHNYVTLHT